MKTKNVMLGVFALVLAAGSAFASLLLPTSIYIRAKLTPNAPITCELTDAACDAAGSFACRVQVPVVVGGNTTSFTYQNSACTIRHLDTDPTATPKVANIPTVYQLF